jgi:hypothetical protein
MGLKYWPGNPFLSQKNPDDSDLAISTARTTLQPDFSGFYPATILDSSMSNVVASQGG